MGKPTIWKYRPTNGWKVTNENTPNPLYVNNGHSRFSFLDLKQYSEDIDDDDTQLGIANGTHHMSGEYDDSGADTDSSVELLERIPPAKTDVKMARRISKDQ